MPGSARKRTSLPHSPLKGVDEFNAVLYKFIAEGSVYHPDVVQWARDGVSFTINDKHKQLLPLIQKYFTGCGKYVTFRRRLSKFGFKRSPEDHSFAAAHFHRKHFVSEGNKRRKRVENVISVDFPTSEPAQASSSKRSADSIDATKSPLQRTNEAVPKDETASKQAEEDSSHIDASQSISAATIDEDIASEHGKSGKQMQEELTSSDAPPPLPKFKKSQVVFAADQDGLMYEAVIRKSLYGPTNHSQIPVGLANSEEEYARVMGHEDEDLVWHYFVHFNNWNVNWDRWVPENRISEITDKSKQYANRLFEEHRALTKQMTKKRSGKKGWQTINGAEFLQAWRLRLTAISAEMKQSVMASSTCGTAHDQKLAARKPKGSKWTKAALALEKNLRMQGLSGKRNQNEASKVALPFALKKILVEEWEIISQCHMLPSIPAKVTVRDALDLYLASKGIKDVHSKRVDLNCLCTDLKRDGGKIETTGEHNVQDAPCIDPGTAMESGKIASAQKHNEPAGPMDATDTCHQAVSDMEATAVGGTNHNEDKVTNASSQSTTNNKKVSVQPNNSTVVSDQEQDWIDMANGIAMFFDEALDTRLLYREELPQARVLFTQSPYKNVPCSELYGSEHLLRLFVRLPEILMDELSDDESRPIFAKINDFIRYIHKNQAELLKQTYRKLNDLELKEQQRLIKLEEKKRQAEEVASRSLPSVNN